MELVFVYGTLKQGFSNHGLLKQSKLIGVAQTKEKFVMYSSGIPYVSKRFKSSYISGEVYSVSNDTMYNLDILECHPEWYVRSKTSVEVIDKKGKVITVDAWLYFNEHIPQNATLIDSGIYGQNKTSRLNSLLL